jgi:epoxyqueuosine reductase
VGIISARPAKRLAAYQQWLDQQLHGEMAYLARPDRVARRQDLNAILPGVQSIICVGLDYATPPLPEAITHDPSRGRISNYAWGVDYHEVMAPRLEALAAWLDTETNSANQSRVYVDTGAILERDHAETAVLGFTGKNTMLIHPRRGSFFFLGEILTTLSIANDQLPIDNSPRPSCGSCRRCLDGCPTQAFPQPYVLDARRCISYLTIELKGWIPLELRPLMGNWIYGCDICQEVCPFNRFAKPVDDGRLEIRDSANPPSPIPHLQSLNLIAPPLLDLLSLTEDDFQRRFAHSPIKRIKRARFLRNVCVAIGNWGSETAVPRLLALLSDPEPLIRGHAAWALHQIGTPEALAGLAATLIAETDNMVRMELAGV